MSSERRTGPDPTLRFSSRVGHYQRFRPGYPQELAALLARECGLGPAARVADIGCGTGLLARVFLEAGCEVTGVEPNREMREGGEQILAGEPRFHMTDGRAESTGLAASAFDFVTAGQAFHWFDPPAARAEFHRILRPDGWLVLVWNERQPAAGFMTEYEALVRGFANESSRIDESDIGRVFGGPFRTARLDNRQALDCDGLIGRLTSSSYAPLPGAANYPAMADELREIFARYQQDGHVTMLYDTHVFYGHVAEGQ
ncbi:MAG: class I SAM-dependent methyltransferase [Bryobacteraceae bacterium]|jgi:SAM-dependent methyltransferase